VGIQIIKRLGKNCGSRSVSFTGPHPVSTQRGAMYPHLRRLVDMVNLVDELVRAWEMQEPMPVVLCCLLLHHCHDEHGSLNRPAAALG